MTETRSPQNMPYRKPQFVNDEIYHIILRGIDDNLIFKDINDYYRGIFSIYEFNNVKSVEILRRRREIQTIKRKLRNSGDRVSSISDTRNKIVEVLAFCFMPNHIHLLVKQLKKGGITKFMRKVGAGYGRYFNRKYNRRGYVFQNRFLAVHIKDDNQLKTIFVYIHTNPIALVEPNWKEKGIQNPRRVIKFLEDYKWSSYPDYIFKKNFPSVTERNFILKIIKKGQGCKEFVEHWVKYKGKIRKLAKLTLGE